MARAASASSTHRTTAKTALDVLKEDHAEVSKLFKQFERFRKDENSDGMQLVAETACKKLAVHAQIEEEIFYPALRETADADDALDEAYVEHSHLKELVAQLEDSEPGDELFEARFKVLSEYVQHHVNEEESTIFAKTRKADIDLAVLGEQLLARKDELGAGAPPIDAAVLAAQGRSRDREPKRGGR